MQNRHFDVAVIGGGIVGTAVVRELSRYTLRSVLIEKEAEVGWGTTKANSGIVHAGFHDKPGTNKAKYCVPGNALYPALCQELDVNFRQNGIFMVARTDEEAELLHTYLEQGRENGVPGIRLVNAEEAVALEPNLTKDTKAALDAPSGGVVAPFELATALMENAEDNGAELLTETRVEDIAWDGTSFTIQTNRGSVTASHIINAAGLFADRIAAMVDDTSFSIVPRKGEEYLMDKAMGDIVERTIFPVPTGWTKGVLVIPTVDGNLMIGPTGETIERRDDMATTAEGFAQVYQNVKTLVEGIDPSKVIAPFAGIRAASDRGDFVIEPSSVCPAMIHAAGMESPGLTAAPAIALDVVRMLQDQVALTKKPDFRPRRRPVVRFHQLSREEQAGLIEQDARYGRIVCRCETVTEAEVIDAVKRGGRTIDGIKFRVRAGAGRCQGGFCMPLVMKILSRELGIPMQEVSKRGGETYQLKAAAKQFLTVEEAVQ